MIYVFICSLIPVLAQCSATINLPQAYALSESRPSLEANRQAIAASQQGELQAFSGYLPQLTANHSSQFNKTLSVNETAHTLTLQGSQLIFNAAGPLIQTKIAALSTERTTYQYHASSQEVRYNVTVNFLQTWLLQEKKTFIEALETYTNNLEEKNNEALKAHTINQTSWSAMAATIAQNRATVAAYPFNLQSSRMTLAQSMGTMQGPPPQLQYDYEKPFPQKKTVGSYIELAYLHRPELKDKVAAEKQQTLIAQSNRLGYLPTVSAYGSLSNTFAGAASERGTSTNVGFTIQWNFFDGLQRVHAAQAADANKLRTTFEKQELKNSIALAITTIYNTICSNEIILESVKKQADMHYEAQKEAEAKYHNGTIDKTAYTKQRMNYLSALYDICTQKTMLHINWQTLAWYCGYPQSGVIDEA